VVRQLNEVGEGYTGITYAIPPPVGDRPSPLVLTSRPLEGLVRQYVFPDVADAFDVQLASLPPGPIIPTTLSTRVFAAGDPSRALGAITIPPPVDGRGPIVRSWLGTPGFVSTSTLEQPDPALGTSGSLVIQSGIPGSTPVVTVSALPPPTNDVPPPTNDTPPPINDRVGFRVRGSNFTVVGSSQDSQIAFDVFDANGRKVGSFGK
jgi:hypothetical protein